MQKKAMGLWSCIALVVGNMIGSGIFSLPRTFANASPKNFSESFTSWCTSTKPW